MVLAPADSAVRDGFGIVHPVVDRLHSAQEGENGLEIVVVHLPEKPPRHDRTNLPCTDLSRVHGLQELGFVVIANTGRIRRQIRSARLSKRAPIQIPTGKFKPGKRHAVLISKGMTPLTSTKLHKICASLHGRGDIRLRNWSMDGSA
jgi:hypothetical protein